jgi:putative acetyltransferase
MSDRPAGTARTPRTGWITRAETGADVGAVRGIHLSAFPTAQEADLVDALRADGSAWIDGLSVVAAEGTGAPVAHALLTRCHIGDTAALCLAPVAVRPEQQGLGAGTAAVRAVLRAAEDLGERYVVVLGHPGYYPRFGFTRASAYGIRLGVDVPDEALMALALGSGRRLPGGTVRYAEPFGI